EEAGGLRKLAAALRIAPGTLSSIANGKRKPNAWHRQKLIKAGIIPAPPRRRRVEWHTVARLLAVSDDILESILRDAKVDIDRARRRARSGAG
ncbi:MAG TPA: hypothetical protein PK954_13350, partial [Anaerolineales bacterium]|nr:hypothetical protein [Anaerolineales bacterium]